MVDYRINLAKSITSTPARRRKIYNGIIIYLSLCAAGLVYTAYLASANVMEAYSEGRERRRLVKAVSATSGFGETFYKNPGKAYDELKLYAEDLAVLQSAFAERVHFLPVLNQLFADFPKDIAVESLETSAQRRTIAFGLAGSGKSIRARQDAWKKNSDLNRLVRIKQVKSEQQVVDGQPVYSVTFEGVLK